MAIKNHSFYFKEIDKESLVSVLSRFTARRNIKKLILVSFEDYTRDNNLRNISSLLKTYQCVINNLPVNGLSSSSKLFHNNFELTKGKI